MAAQTHTTVEENERLSRRVPEEIATERNLELIDELYAADAVEHLPMGDTRGLDEIRADFERFLEAFPDFSATVEESVASGDAVAMRVTLRGTHEGSFMGIEPTNRQFEVSNMVFTRIQDGKIVERWVQPDMHGMLQQLGIVESPTA